MVKKTDPRALKPDWDKLNRIAPWSVISSRDLGHILGVHLQTVSNWRLRGVLPPPIHSGRLNQSKIYYRCATIRAWLNGTDEKTETDYWIKHGVLGTEFGFEMVSEEVIEFFAYIWRKFNFERPIRI